jgi:hypothetical protein
LVDRVARAILGGDAGDVVELDDARRAALDVLEVLSGHLSICARGDVRLPYEAPRLTFLGQFPSIELHVVPSVNREGQLSLRLHADDDTWTPVFLAMNAAGFKPGDVVRLTMVRR